MLKPQAETVALFTVLLVGFMIKSKGMPVDLQDALKRATSLESFMEILNVPEQSDINIEHREGNALTYENEACKPVEVMVPVPQPKKRRALHFPVYVKLFRCSGGCDIEPRLSRCIATGHEKIPIKVALVSWRNGEKSTSKLRKVSEVRIQNDTQCGCACKREKHCNSETQKWNNRTCRCECIKYQTCRAPLVWSKHSCCCDCPKSRAVACRGPGKVWDPNRCRCVCWKERCSAGYYRDPETCRCTCYKNWCPNIHQIYGSKHVRNSKTIELARPNAL